MLTVFKRLFPTKAVPSSGATAPGGAASPRANKAEKVKGAGEGKGPSRAPLVPGRVAVPKNPAAGPDSPGEPKSPVQRDISSRSEIPTFTELLTGPGGRFELPESRRDELAAVLLDGGRFALLSSRGTFGNAYFASLKSDLEKGGLIAAALIRADAGLISGLYDLNSRVEDASATSGMTRYLDELLQAAIERHVSDIHLKIDDDHAVVQFRTHGELVVYSELAPQHAEAFARAAHNAADVDSKPPTYSKTDQQSMSVSRTLQSGQSVKQRDQTSPVWPGGQKIVMRVLLAGRNAPVKSLEILGYEPDQIRMLHHMLSTPVGVIMMAGTTGSGKSTTLQTLMKLLRQGNEGASLYSVEDPPEYVLEGVDQIPVVRRKNVGANENPFAETMRAILRKDPDVIMVGEVRDRESGLCLIGMTQSGHKVLSTVHASSAFGITERLEKLGIDVQTQASRGFISGFVYQSLLPVLCPHCKVRYAPLAGDKLDQAMPGIHGRVTAVSFPEDDIYVKGDGCDRCGGLGISGRTVVAEILIPDLRILQMFREGKFADAYEYWRSKRTKPAGLQAPSMIGYTALDHAILKMRRGEVSPLNIEQRLGHLVGYDVNVATASGAVDLLSDLG
jgi:general secretion pathway protein E